MTLDELLAALQYVREQSKDWGGRRVVMVTSCDYEEIKRVDFDPMEIALVSDRL
ncbi:hypothetical protein [Pseudonocardia sp. NPDC049154]|uniref:hypothetical protein n=1 Tax=Pseudonocardia sp. NPDC049154 TaxID=3155501 RepID=UPI0033C78FDB